MRSIAVNDDFGTWRREARRLLGEGIEPDAIVWQSRAQPTLFESAPEEPAQPHDVPSIPVPRGFLEFAERAACYRDSRRWTLLYELLWRVTHGERDLLDDDSDPIVAECRRMERGVRGDCRRMMLFGRFRKIGGEGDARQVMWFRPAHLILRLVAPVLARRLGKARGAILTPDACVEWNGERLLFGPGIAGHDAPRPESIEELWRTYDTAVLAPIREKSNSAGQAAPRHWSTLPEVRLIPRLLRQAQSQVLKMSAERAEAAQPPQTTSLPRLRAAAALCTACPLCKSGTQTVFGEGPRDARIMLIGEQPGDVEDQVGHPFVGPAGRVLAQALEAIGLRRDQVYLTNAVKHFKWEPRGKRRIHKKPNGGEIRACRPWLEREVRAVRPELIVCLGSTAAQSVLGKPIRVLRDRGKLFPSSWAAMVTATVHPSALLRIPDEQLRAEAYRAFVHDLRRAVSRLDRGAIAMNG